MKSKLLIYFLPALLFTLMIYGYTTQDNPDFNPKVSNDLTDVNSGVSSIFTTSAWTTLTASPHAVSRSTCAYVKVGATEYIYQFGGGSAAQLRNVARYDLTANVWTNNYSTMPADISAGGTVVMNDSLMYVFGGFNPVLGKTLKYNYIANVWTDMAPMTTAVTDVAAVKYNDSLVYVIGGGDGLFSPTPTLVTNAVQLYNVKRNTYSSAGTIPVATAMMGYGIYKDTIIITAGWTGLAAVANSYKGIINSTNPNVVTWTTLPVYPVGAVTRMASYLVKKPGQGVGIACSGGAISGSTLTASGSFWNFCTQAWQTLPNNSLARSNLKGTGAGDSTMYIVGGFTTVGVGNCEKLTFSQIDGSCASGPPPPLGATLVLVHDSVSSTAQRKADRDTLNRYLPALIGNYTMKSFDTTTALGDLSAYNTIIVQETSFDAPISLRWLGAGARGTIKTWLSTGTPTSKKSLILIGADEAYNYSRPTSLGQDLVFAETYGKFIFRIDNATGSTLPSVTGVATDIGNTRALSATPPGGSYWPDGAGIIAGGSAVLYKYQNHTATDTLAAIGNVQPGYVVATVLQDPRYFTGGFRDVFASTLSWVVANGGLITGTGTGNNPVSIANDYQLSQNYPNPFNPATKINYTIPKSGLVTLKIYDISGREVSTLVNEFKNPGNYELRFDGTNLSSGTYFYRIETGSFIQTKKMILLK